MKIGIVAYACGPKQGSEFRLGWNLPMKLAELGHEVTVFSGSSDGQMGGFEDLYLVREEIESKYRIRFIMIDNDIIGRFYNFLNLRLGLKFFFYPSLNRWNYLAYQRAQSFSFEITHHLGPIGFRSPGYLWKLGFPHVWGPIGGAQDVPLHLIKSRISIYYVKSFLKNIFNKLDLYRPSIKSAVRFSRKLIFSTESNLEIFSEHYGVTGDVYSDQAMDCSVDVSLED